MLLVLLKRKNPECNVVMSTSYKRLVQTNDVKGGVITSRSSYEDYDFAKALKNFKSSDFTIDNILQVGAYDMLKPHYVSSMSDMDFADKFQDIKFVESQN